MKTSLSLMTTTLLLLAVGSSVVVDVSPLGWLTDSSHFNITLKIGLILLLSAIVLYRPPRPRWLRYSLGALAAFFSGVAVYYLFSYRINLVDVLLYFEASIILIMEALEVKKIRLSQPESSAYKVPVRFS